MARLLVIHHSNRGSAHRLAQAAIDAARDPAISGVEVVEREALATTPDDVLAADAYLLVTAEHFGYMSGALKHVFDVVYEPCLEHTRGRPYALIVKAGSDGTGAVTAVERIVTGLGWRRALPPVIAVGELTDDHLAAAAEQGGALAAGVEAGVF